MNMSITTMLSAITRARAMFCCSLGMGTCTPGAPYNAASGWVGSGVITSGRKREKGEAPLREPMGSQTYNSRTCRDVLYRRPAGNRTHGLKQMRIKDIRQELHMLLHTQGVDGLLPLYNRLETGGRVLLLCLLSAEAGWAILVTGWLLLERAYLKMRLFLRV